MCDIISIEYIPVIIPELQDGNRKSSDALLNCKVCRLTASGLNTKPLPVTLCVLMTERTNVLKYFSSVERVDCDAAACEKRL